MRCCTSDFLNYATQLLKGYGETRNRKIYAMRLLGAKRFSLSADLEGFVLIFNCLPNKYLGLERQI